MKRKILCIYFPIILGLLIYVTFRSKSLLYFYFFKVTNLDIYIIQIRKFVFLYRKLFPNWVVYSLPDGLWIFSFGSALLYKHDNFRKRAFLFSILFFLTLSFEFIQGYFGGHGSLIGTFDFADMVCFFLGYTFSLLINYFFYKKNKSTFLPYTKLNFWEILKEEKKNIIIFITLAFLPTLI